MRTLTLTMSVLVPMLIGCRHRVDVPEPIACPGMCSEGSSYSPTMRLFVIKSPTSQGISVRLDSGLVRVPGTSGAFETPFLMEHLYLRAFVAISLDSAQASLAGDHAWHALAWSDSVSVASGLRYGESRALPPLEFRIPIAESGTPPGAWLGFAITGDAVNPSARPPEVRLNRGGVRVFVCDPVGLGGDRDVQRAKRLGGTYTAVC